jgi:hypothetical protein
MCRPCPATPTSPPPARPVNWPVVRHVVTTRCVIVLPRAVYRVVPQAIPCDGLGALLQRHSAKPVEHRCPCSFVLLPQLSLSGLPSATCHGGTRPLPLDARAMCSYMHVPLPALRSFEPRAFHASTMSCISLNPLPPSLPLSPSPVSVSHTRALPMGTNRHWQGQHRT